MLRELAGAGDTLSTPLLTPLLSLTGQLQGERQRFRVTGASRTYVSSHSWLEIDYAGLAHNAQARPTAPPSTHPAVAVSFAWQGPQLLLNVVVR